MSNKDKPSWTERARAINDDTEETQKFYGFLVSKRHGGDIFTPDEEFYSKFKHLKKEHLILHMFAAATLIYAESIACDMELLFDLFEEYKDALAHK